MMAARSVRVIVRGTTSGGTATGGAIVTRWASAAPQSGGIERRGVGRPGAGERRGPGDGRLATEQADPDQRAVGQVPARIAVGAVEQEPRPQLGLRIGGLLVEAGRVHDRRSREHRPALDQDELRGHGHERADIPDPVDLQAGERVEIGLGEAAERHGQDIELAGLDK